MTSETQSMLSQMMKIEKSRESTQKWSFQIKLKEVLEVKLVYHYLDDNWVQTEIEDNILFEHYESIIDGSISNCKIGVSHYEQLNKNSKLTFIYFYELKISKLKFFIR